ncbi:MAG: hypothetical protein U9N32_08805 [Spirochaetota bacterium]|nr:hypothetical protein [Spirochaetota bacterium]
MTFSKLSEHGKKKIWIALLIPIGAWLYRLTGNTSAGAMTTAMIVAWFFTSSSVLAPIPV